MDKNNLWYKFLDSTRRDDYAQEVSLELYEDMTFKLSNETSGFFGSVCNTYMGSYTLHESNIQLVIQEERYYSYTVVEDEPSESIHTREEIINAILSEESTVTFVFPNSRGEWKVTLRKV